MVTWGDKLKDAGKVHRHLRPEIGSRLAEPGLRMGRSVIYLRPHAAAGDSGRTEANAAQNSALRLPYLALFSVSLSPSPSCLWLHLESYDLVTPRFNEPVHSRAQLVCSPARGGNVK